MRYLAWFGLLLLAACARPQPQAVLPLPEIGLLMQQLAQNAAAYTTLDGEAKVGIKTGDKYLSSNQFLLVAKPDRLRTDALTSFGQLILQLAVDGEELAVFLNTSVPGRFFKGAASDDNLARFTRLPLRVRDLVRLLLYELPLITHRQVQVSRHQDGFLLSLSGAGGQRQEVLFDPALRVLGSRYLQQEQLQLAVSYEAFSKNGDFPRTLHLQVPGQQTSASVRFSQLQTNVAIPAERFVLQRPANAQLEELPH